jgi:hypothetical protein
MNSGCMKNREIQSDDITDDAVSDISVSASSSSLSEKSGESISRTKMQKQGTQCHIFDESKPYSPSKDSLRNDYIRRRRYSELSLHSKASKILERELMIEKAIAQHKAYLADANEQINQIGERYMAVRRFDRTRPQRKRVEIPGVPISPIHGRISHAMDRKSMDCLDSRFSDIFDVSSGRSRASE